MLGVLIHWKGIREVNGSCSFSLTFPHLVFVFSSSNCTTNLRKFRLGENDLLCLLPSSIWCSELGNVLGWALVHTEGRLVTFIFSTHQPQPKHYLLMAGLSDTIRLSQVLLLWPQKMYILY